MRKTCRLWCFLTLVFGLGIASNNAQPESEAGYSVHIALVGDSTVTDKSGWGLGFSGCVADNIKCTNVALGGRSSSSFREEGHWKELLTIKPDWVLIQFGHNDEPGHPGKENPPETGFRRNIERYIDESRSAGIKPVLVTPISRRQWGKSEDDADRIVSSLEPYAEVVREIAAEKNVPLIDLHWRSKEVYQSLGKRGCEMITSRKENGQWDGTHMNRTGAVMFGSMVAMDCRSYVPELANCFRTSKMSEMQRNNRPPSMGSSSDYSTSSMVSESESKGAQHFVVARDGTGDFHTIQEAVAAAPANNSDRTVIEIKNGIHMGQIIVPASKPNISFVGEDRKKCLVSYALTIHDPVPPGVPDKLAGYGVIVEGKGFHASNITFRQIAGDHGQAIALRIDGDQAILRDCDLLGWQDTVRLESGRHYLRDCYIEGRVDYVYGGATAVMENCTLHTKGEGYVTAASTPREKQWGYVFLNCRLTGTGRHEVFLGRPWRPFASVTYLSCTMDDSVKPEGWDNWRNSENEQTARYSEYRSKGPGGSPDTRVPWAKQLSEDQAAKVTLQSVLGGADNWDARAEYQESGSKDQ